MRSLYSSPFLVTSFVPAAGFSTASTVEESLHGSSPSSSYSSRALRTFRALRTLRARRPSSNTAFRFRFLFGGDRTNARRVVRQALRPLLARLLPGCPVFFNFRPSGVALRHPNLSAFSLARTRQLQRGAALEREISIFNAPEGSRDSVVAVFPHLLREIVAALNTLGRRPLQKDYVSSSPFATSTSPLQLRLLAVDFPEGSPSSRRAAQRASLVQLPSPLAVKGVAAVTLGTTAVVDSVVRTLLVRRESAAVSPLAICLAPPLPFVSLLSLLARRCNSLRVDKLSNFDSMVQRLCSRTANLCESGSIPLRV